MGWAAADKIAGYFGPSRPDPAEIKAAEALNAAQAQRQEIAALRVHVETLKNKLDAQAQKSRSAESTIASLQKGLAERKGRRRVGGLAIAGQDRENPEPGGGKSGRAQRRQDFRPPRSPSRCRVRPKSAGPGRDAGRPVARPAPYRAFVLRDVGPGRALVEGGGRIEEVEPGDILPGGAMVERIERRGQSWIVMTDRGYIGPDFNWDD